MNIGSGCRRMPDMYGENDNEESITDMHRALDLGINF
jgi:aryl-alcohol dehydrogenase-like predicted oxidoreductase